jgi:hypothetical protein
MGCLLAVFAGLFTRFALIISGSRGRNGWTPRSPRSCGLSLASSSCRSRRIYVLLWQPGTGVTGSDWLWIALAVLLDLAHWSASASQRNAVPRGSAL